MLTAWADESGSRPDLDPGAYLLAATLCDDDDVAELRGTLDSLRIGEANRTGMAVALNAAPNWSPPSPNSRSLGSSSSTWTKTLTTDVIVESAWNFCCRTWR